MRNCFWIALRRSPINGCRRGNAVLVKAKPSISQAKGRRTIEDRILRYGYFPIRKAEYGEALSDFSVIYRVFRYFGSFYSELSQPSLFSALFCFEKTVLPLSVTLARKNVPTTPNTTTTKERKHNNAIHRSTKQDRHLCKR